MNRLPLAKRRQIIAMLVEGNSLRATSRVTDTAINTVMRLMVETGQNCQAIQDEYLNNLTCARIQIDEIWSFCQSKAHQIWTFTAIDPDTKLVPHWLVGRRNVETTKAFLYELGDRMAGKVQLTSDGFKPYADIVNHHAWKWDYAQQIKLYEEGGDEKLSPKDRYIGSQLKVITGEPFERDISTSICERNNLTMRMSVKRLARKTNAHSKKMDNHCAAIALHFGYYNLCRIHSSLRVTPAMAAGITDRVWEIEELLQQ